MFAFYVCGPEFASTQGTTNAGAFLPGVYAYDYGVEDVAALRLHGFTAVRFPVNCSTALDPASMRKLLSFVQALGGHGIVCLFEERAVDAKGDDHGCGRIEDPSVAVAAWTSIHRTFAPHEGVMYELFNEPFGYTNPSEYLAVMRHIIRHAVLPVERCMLDGCGYASDVVVLSQIGWEGQMGLSLLPTLAAGNKAHGEELCSEGARRLDWRCLTCLHHRVRCSIEL